MAVGGQVMEMNPYRLYVTWINRDGASELIEGDTHFPEIDPNIYENIDSLVMYENEYRVNFVTYQRKDGNTETNNSQD